MNNPQAAEAAQELPNGTEPFAFMLSDEQLAKIRTSGVYPIVGYAPGRYQGKCSTCERIYTGDKRSVQCFPCAIKCLTEAALSQSPRPVAPGELVEEVKRLRTILSKIVECAEACSVGAVDHLDIVEIEQLARQALTPPAHQATKSSDTTKS
jgi:hypothetical protein